MQTSDTRRRRAVTGDEVDIHGRWRRFLCSAHRPGETRRVKRMTNRRERREGRAEVAEEVRDAW